MSHLRAMRSHQVPMKSCFRSNLPTSLASSHRRSAVRRRRTKSSARIKGFWSARVEPVRDGPSIAHPGGMPSIISNGLFRSIRPQVARISRSCARFPMQCRRRSAELTLRSEPAPHKLNPVKADLSDRIKAWEGRCGSSEGSQCTPRGNCDLSKFARFGATIPIMTLCHCINIL